MRRPTAAAIFIIALVVSLASIGPIAQADPQAIEPPYNTQPPPDSPDPNPCVVIEADCLDPGALDGDPDCPVWKHYVLECDGIVWECWVPISDFEIETGECINEP